MNTAIQNYANMRDEELVQEYRMTEEQINIAIAERCGFTDIMWPTGFHQQMSDEKSKQAGGRWRFQIPDYYNDLNAMHEAENLLDENGREDYWNELWNLTGGEFELCHATCMQRAEAFLKTINKWEKS